jgi:hypothetical protein
MNIIPYDNIITEISDTDKQLFYDAMYGYYLQCSLTAKTNSVAKDTFKNLANRADATLICMRNAWGQDIIY